MKRVNLAGILLTPFSWLYEGIIRARNFCYDVGIFRTIHVSVPVVSVGNLTTGGTGKTPFVEYLARNFVKSQKRVAVISRGYGRSTSGTVIVSDGHQVLVSAQQAGDEPYQIAQKFSSAIVIVDEQRARAAQLAIERFQVDVILLDDGFQHRGLARDLDIIMMPDRHSSAETLMLPAGRKREPFSSLRRADIVVCTRARASDQRRKELPFSKPILRMEYTPVVFRHLFSKDAKELSAVAGTSCCAFCGIGTPQSFRETLHELQVIIKEFLIFPDHHQFTLRDIELVKKNAEQNGVQYLLTTEKDAMRLQQSPHNELLNSLPVYYLEIEATIVEGASLLEEKLHSLFGRSPS